MGKKVSQETCPKWWQKTKMASFKKNAILKISARHLEFFFLEIFFWYILGLCTTNWLLQIEKKNLVCGGQTRSKKSRFFPKNDAILNQSAILISQKKISNKVRY
jgi:hypothetical protein